MLTISSHVKVQASTCTYVPIHIWKAAMYTKQLTCQYLVHPMHAALSMDGARISPTTYVYSKLCFHTLFPVDDCPCRNGECIVDGDSINVHTNCTYNLFYILHLNSYVHTYVRMYVLVIL